MGPPVAEPRSALFDWLRAHGSRFPGATVHRYDGMGLGLAAARDLGEEEQILIVPRELWFTRKTAHTTFRPLLDRVHAAGVHSHSMSRLALLLALERAASTSFFRPYLDALGEPTVPYTLTDRERDACQGLPILGWIDEQRELTVHESTRVRAALPESAPAIDTASWQWAYGHVMQRTFSVDVEDEEVWVLVPGMDLCNHDPDPNARYFAETEGWLLEAARPVREGEQVTIRYGKTKTSTDLFLYYGFVPRHNPYDRIGVRLALSGDDPDRDEKQAALEPLGLRSGGLIGPDGVVPSALLHAAILWGLDWETFHAPQPDLRRPDRAAAALLRIAQALTDSLASFPTTIEEDERVLNEPSDGWMRSLVSYRRNAKVLLREAARAIREHSAAVERDGWDPGDVVPPDDAGRYAMVDVRVAMP